MYANTDDTSKLPASCLTTVGDVEPVLVAFRVSEVILSPKLMCCSEGPPGPFSPENPRKVGTFAKPAELGSVTMGTLLEVGWRSSRCDVVYVLVCVWVDVTSSVEMTVVGAA